MALTAEEIPSGDSLPTRLSRSTPRFVQLVPPAASDRSSLIEWALAVTAAADQRVAELESRLAYLESLTVTDELTMALNRRGFLMAFSRAIDAARRGGSTGVVIICDLDGFKAVNDHLGHAIGDTVLRQVATVLMRRVRKMDAVARLGGDEFALLLISASVTSAHRKCQTLAEELAATVQIGGRPIGMSASFGIAAYDGTEDEEALLHRADMAMYAEKRRIGLPRALADHT